MALADVRAFAVATFPDMTQLQAVEDLEVAGAAERRPARLYRPRTPLSSGAAIVYFHGGGWLMHTLDSYNQLASRLAGDVGATVISVDYRLAPEHPFPAGLEDAYAAVAWVAAHAEELDVDPERLTVAGDSAGGNFAAVVSLLARDQGGPKIAHQLLIYPGVDHRLLMPGVREVLEREMSSAERAARRDGYWFVDNYLGGAVADADDWRISPIATDLSNLPPVTMVTGGFDPTRFQSIAYAERLTASGVEVRHFEGVGMPHAFYDLPVDEARRVRREVALHLRRVLSR
jgi:acetyl esterase